MCASRASDVLGLACPGCAQLSFEMQPFKETDLWLPKFLPLLLRSLGLLYLCIDLFLCISS